MAPRARDNCDTMPPPATHEDRRVHYHETARPPPPYSHQPFPSGPPPGSMRIPPSPRDYLYYEGPPPRWRQREALSPPYYAYEMPPREEPPRPYMPPMHGEDPRMPPPPSEEYAPRYERRGPPIHYRLSAEYYPHPPSKRVKPKRPGQTSELPPPESAPPAPSSPQKPGALSLLAKVASGNREQPKQKQQTKETENPEYASPVRRAPHSPHSPHAPVIWTPPRSSHPYQRGPPPRGEWREGPYPTPPTPSRRDYYPSQWTYEGPRTPPAVVERVSFDEGYQHSPPQEEYPPRGWSERPPPQYEYPPAEYHHRRAYSGQYVTPSASREMEHEEPYLQHSPYTYVQQPQARRPRGKTVLHKKFSWKHYPELEQFLIANRDEYLRHSALNYTAEQKQFNNWLTDRLLEIAERYEYVFDPDDFNYVGIRDRIRCYYKSYVQTVRKRAQANRAKQEAAAKKLAEAHGEHESEKDNSSDSKEGGDSAEDPPPKKADEESAGAPAKKSEERV